MWLLAFSPFFFSLAAIKRQAELIGGSAAGWKKAHGRDYLTGDLAIASNIAVSAGLVSVLVLALYLKSKPVQLIYGTCEMLWGVCPVLLFWNTRIAILAQRGQMHADPLVFAARDKFSLVCPALFRVLALAGWSFEQNRIRIVLRRLCIARATRKSHGAAGVLAVDLMSFIPTLTDAGSSPWSSSFSKRFSRG